MYNPQLETFIRVADAGSFNKAAEELFISPPAVIKQINLLEAQLGLTLFVRTHRGLKLTEAGKSLYQDAKYVIGYCRESVERARAAMQKEENVIRIGTSPMTPVQNMVDLWPKFQEYCPDIKFQMIPFENTPENAREILKNLGKNIDVIAGIFDESMLNYRQCSGTELCRVPLCCAVSVNHRLAKKKRLTIQDLYGENVSDDISEALMRGVIRDLRASIKNPQDYTARTDPNVPIEEVAGVMAIQNRYSMMARWHEVLFPVLEEFTAEAMDQNQKLLALPQDMAREKNATLAQLSLAWMLCKKPWIVPIPGTRKLEQLRENAGAADVVLTPSEVSALDDALDTIPMSEVFGGSRIVKKC